MSPSVKASVAFCKMTVQMKRDVSKQKTPHNNKMAWKAKQGKLEQKSGRALRLEGRITDGKQKLAHRGHTQHMM